MTRDTMATQYCQHVITRDGALRNSMYSAGPSCATIELARQLRGDIHCRPEYGERVAIVRRDQLPDTSTDSAGYMHRRYSEPIIVELVGGAD